MGKSRQMSVESDLSWDLCCEADSRDIDTGLGGLPTFGPVDVVKTYSCFLDYRGINSSIGRADRIDYSDDVSQP